MTVSDPTLEALISSLDHDTTEYGVLIDDRGLSIIVGRHRATGGVHTKLIEDTELAERLADHVLQQGAKSGAKIEDLGWTASPAAAKPI